MTTIRLSREGATDAITAATKNDHIAFLTALPGGGLRRDGFDLATAKIVLMHAELFAYQEGPFGFNLAVLSGATLYHFDVPMPLDGPSKAEELLAEHVSVLIRALEKCANMLDRHETDILWEAEALAALRTYMEDDE